MASIDFFADNFGVQNLNGSGLGFFGTGFGRSVAVGEWQGTTFITDGNGTTEGAQVNNIKWAHPNSGSINGAAEVVLTAIPNYLATLNVRFTHSSDVQTQNCKLRIYDRSSINNAPSGVTCKVAELIHPDTVQNDNGSGDTSWLTPVGSAVVMDLAPSPGLSGIYAGNGSNSTVTSTRHDHYLAITASPDSIGSKNQFALYVEMEYL